MRSRLLIAALCAALVAASSVIVSLGAAGATEPARAVEVSCSLDRGETFFPSNLAQCEALGGLWIDLACLPAFPPAAQQGAPQAAPPPAQPRPGLRALIQQARAGGGWLFVRQTDPNGPQAAWLQQLLTDVRSSGIMETGWQRATGLPLAPWAPGPADGRPYVPDNGPGQPNYDCDDFAADFDEIFTTLRGYDVSFTIVRCTPPHNFPRFRAHAVNDVLAPDGTVTFIDAAEGRRVDLDYDGDGTVGAGTSSRPFDTSDQRRPPAWATEDDCRIEVYESADDAVRNGVQLDRTR